MGLFANLDDAVDVNTPVKKKPRRWAEKALAHPAACHARAFLRRVRFDVEHAKLRRVTFGAGSFTAVLLLSACGTTEEKADTVESNAKEYLVYFGTYTGEESQGIYVSRFNAATGEATSPVLAAEATDPNFLAVHPSRRFLCAVSRTQGQGGQPIGTVVSFAIDKVTGKLALLNTVSSGGPDPTHLNVDHTGRAVFAVDSDKGTLTPVEHVSTQGERPRNFQIDPTGRYLFAANQSADNVVVFRIDAEAGRLSPAGQVLEIDSPVCVRFVALD